MVKIIAKKKRSDNESRDDGRDKKREEWGTAEMAASEFTKGDAADSTSVISYKVIYL